MRTTVEIDAKRYGQLLAMARPARIRDEKENERILAEIERLIDKGEGKLTPEGIVRLTQRFRSLGNR